MDEREAIRELAGAPRGDDLRKHLRDFHYFEVGHLRIAPDEGLVLEHQYHHEDGLDFKAHEHGEG